MKSISICLLGESELRWRKHLYDGDKHKLSESESAPVVVVCPEEFSQRHGHVFVGWSSGVVQLWNLPDKNGSDILFPPPLPLAEVSPVQWITLQRFHAPFEFSEDIASPFRHEFAQCMPKSPTRERLMIFIWIFFGDGRGTLWQVDPREPVENLPTMPIISQSWQPYFFRYHESTSVNEFYQIRSVFE